MRLEDRVIVVTGGAGTIGRQVCLLLADEGASVAVTDVSADPLEELLEELRKSQGAAWGRPADVTSLEDFSAFASQTRRELGPIDALVNVAGSFAIVDFVDSDPDQWEAMLSANLLTAMVGCRVVLPEMLEAGAGSIVNFASTAGEYGSIRPSAAYAAAKAGVIGFTKSLAREVSPRGVRVNAISPGPIDTPALQAQSEEQRAVAASRTLLGRMGTPRDIAQGVAYLASDESSFVTGTVLQVNGGSLL
ncbi:MAG: short-chain dehydrogenase/reductase [Acidimicrobiaceae bacterium]|jgi:2-hydroxycyclohexanecarboxyl-CoA dehydrogenase|nr:short-chain dehydrogenase/reductase [Acidimicrobiaceae bacterium]